MADNIKEYRLNDMFVIRCYLKPDDYKVEVLVVQVGSRNLGGF